MEFLYFFDSFKRKLDTMWNDIDYMEAYKLYTWDPVHYPVREVRKWVDELHANNQKYVVIVDPGVKVEPGYEVYDRGIREKLYITHPDGKTPIVNKVWPGKFLFPSYCLPRIHCVSRFFKTSY
jgi:alpha-glucosidase (family GH31 glycosyl hydrolase)